MTVPSVIAEEVQRAYGLLPIQPSDVVLDLGAHVGAASALFLDRGAARVIAVEPDPANVAQLRTRLADRRATVIHAAVGAEAGATTLYAHHDRSYLSTTVGDDPGREAVRVPVVAFDDLLDAHRPTVVKCDIEFGEYDLPWWLPLSVRVVALELHIRYDLIFLERRETEDELRRRRWDAALLMETIVGQGFELLQGATKEGPPPAIEDTTGIHPLARSLDLAWVRA